MNGGEGGGRPSRPAREPGSGTELETEFQPAGSGPWIGIAANANSGTGRGRARVRRLIARLREHGLDARVAWTVPERRALVARAALDSACLGIVAAGGDGTIHALINERPTVPVTALPVGTENLFAAEFALPRDPVALADMIARGWTVAIDLGAMTNAAPTPNPNPETEPEPDAIATESESESDSDSDSDSDCRFSLMTGVGFDAEVVTRHHDQRLDGDSGIPGTTSRLAYVWPILESSFRYRFPRVRAILEPGDAEPAPGDSDSDSDSESDADRPAAEVLEGAMVLLFNLPRYALGLHVVPPAPPADGLLDLIVFRNPGVPHMVRYLWMVFRGIHLRRPDVVHRRVRRATIETVSHEPAPIQVDGDPAGFLRPGRALRFRSLPGALRVLVPEAYARSVGADQPDPANARRLSPLTPGPQSLTLPRNRNGNAAKTQIEANSGFLASRTRA